MVQAARSGKQNIAEGSKASGTSKEMEIKLMNVARASLEELLIDYCDYLRVRDFPLWEKGSKEALFVSGGINLVLPTRCFANSATPDPPMLLPTSRFA
jgi:hypothetical protein